MGTIVKLISLITYKSVCHLQVCVNNYIIISKYTIICISMSHVDTTELGSRDMYHLQWCVGEYMYIGIVVMI